MGAKTAQALNLHMDARLLFFHRESYPNFLRERYTFMCLKTYDLHTYVWGREHTEVKDSSCGDGGATT